MMPLYVDRLMHFGYRKSDRKLLCTEYIGFATVLDDGRIACMVCDTWPKYCPDYDKECIECGCHMDDCDWKKPYIPKVTYGNLTSFVEHFKTNHENESPRDWSCFSGEKSIIW